MKASIITLHDPFNLHKNKEVEEINEQLSINEIVDKKPQLKNKPFICLINGEPILRKDWDKPIKENDILVIHRIPEGGVGKSINKLFEAVFKPFSEIFGSLFGGLVGTPETPSTNQNNQLGAASPTYNLGAQGNSARLGESIPVLYGKHIIFPDFGAATYNEYIGNQQFLYYVLVVGQGYYDIQKILIEDTDISNFAEISYNIIQPGGSFSLVNPSITTSEEISDQELIGPNLSGTYIGPFIANPAYTTTNQLIFDITCPRGVYSWNGTSLSSQSITFVIEVRPVDNDGNYTGAGTWTTLATETITATTVDAVRKTYKYSVTAGRYEARVKRTSNDNDTASQITEIHWDALRAQIAETPDYSGLTLVEMKLRATNNLSSKSSRKVNMIVQRLLNTYNPMTGWSAGRVATSSIAWAIADMLKADYGGKLPDYQIDLDGLYELEQIWSARGDEFNGVFDRKMSCWEALKIIARVGRAAPVQQGAIQRIIRDTEQTIPTAMFSTRNIVKGSFSVEYTLASEDEYDGVTVQYFDKQTWSVKEVSKTYNNLTPVNPATIDMQLGCTNLAQATREALYLARNNSYRRKKIFLTTELEGYIPMYGDLVTVSHDMPMWGLAGEVVDVSSGRIILSEPVDFTEPGTYYMAFRDRKGVPNGPWEVEAASDNEFAVELVGSWSYTIDSSLDFVIATNLTTSETIRLYIGSKEELTHFTFGLGEAYTQKGLIKSLKPQGDVTVTVSLINEDSRVHED